MSTNRRPTFGLADLEKRLGTLTVGVFLHVWRTTEQDGLHFVNLPAVAYAFNAAEVTGWVDCRLQDHGMTLEVRAHDPQHAAHGKVTEFAWRGA